MKIICGHCGEAFTIGEDAFIVSDEDKYHSLSEAEAGVLFLGQPSRKPDMVMHWTRPTSETERSDELKKAAEINKAIARGERREWWCGKCYNHTPNPYTEI